MHRSSGVSLCTGGELYIEFEINDKTFRCIKLFREALRYDNIECYFLKKSLTTFDH